MDKNDPFNRPSGDTGGTNDEEHEFIDDARYDDPNAPEVREAEYAAGQEEWDQPIDEFAEEEQPVAAQEPQQKRDPFADEGPVEDEFSERTENEHDLEEPSEEAVAPASRGKSSMAGMKPPSSLMKYLPIVGGGIAAVVIAFFGLQQFMGGSQTPFTQPSLEHQNTWDSASANPPQTDSATQTAANEFQPLQQPGQQPEQQPLAQHTNQPSETSSNMITPAQNTHAPLAQGETTSATATMQQASNPLEARITELTQQLETMKQTQDQLNQKLQAATATPPSMDESSKAAQQALVDRIAQLEQRLSSAPSASTSVASASVDTPSGKTARKSKRSAQPVTDQPASDMTTRNSKKASVDFMAAKKTKRAKRRSSVEANSTSGTEGYAPMNSRPFQGWILRSAQPGSAWLSQGATSSDLRRVVPGDKVQGLGTVTAIRQVAGRWIVEGTQGAVR